MEWTTKEVSTKYETYPLGYEAIKGARKSIQAYIVKIDQHPIGYIQFYDAYDFPREYKQSLKDLPENLAGIDYYIGEVRYLRKGLGTQILKDFLVQYVSRKFQNCFVDPEIENTRAIQSYEKVGFQIIKPLDTEQVNWMVLSLRCEGD